MEWDHFFGRGRAVELLSAVSYHSKSLAVSSYDPGVKYIDTFFFVNHNYLLWVTFFVANSFSLGGHEGWCGATSNGKYSHADSFYVVLVDINMFYNVFPPLTFSSITRADQSSTSPDQSLSTESGKSDPKKNQS